MTRRRAPTDPPEADAEPDEPEVEKKERVIHTRVPESLEAQLRERAKHLGISVSNLVRNVLGHTFGLVGDVVADGHAIARAARGDTPGSPAPPAAPVPSPMPGAPPMPAAPFEAPPSIDDVLGWQPFILGKNAVCTRCNAILPRGSEAAASVADARAPRLVICPTCLKELRA